MRRRAPLRMGVLPWSWLAGLLVLLRVGATAAQTPVFPTGTELVIVDVVVTDDDGRPVTGLTREDFTVEDEGVRQEIVEFEGVDTTGAAADADDTDSGAWARIAVNDSPTAPSRAFLIVFDDLHLSPDSAKRVRATLQKFIERQLRDTDCVTIAPTGGGAWWSGCLDSERADVNAFLGRLEGKRRRELAPERMSDYEAMRIHADRDNEAMMHVALRFVANDVAQTTADLQSRNTVENQLPAAEAAAPLVRTLAADLYERVRARNEHLLGSLERGLNALGGGRARRVVILASDGFIRDQRVTGFQRVRETARRANAALYFLDARADDSSIDLTQTKLHPDPENRFRYMSTALEYAAEESSGAEALAADTGGFTVRGNDLDLGLARVAAESRVFYLLGYEPSQQGKAGRFRKIKVSVRRPGVKVRARSGYYPGPPPSETAAADAPPPTVRRALDAIEDARAIPVRMTSYVRGNAPEGRVTVLLTAEVDPASVTLKRDGGQATGGLDSYSTVTARDTGEAGRKQLGHDLALRPEAMRGLATTWLPVTHTYELPAGRYQARLVVVDRASGRTGSVRHTFDVPSPKGLRLTTPILTDVVAPGENPDAAARPLPVARRAFGVGSRLACAVEVWGGGSAEVPSSVEIVYEVWRADGSVAARSNPKLLARDATGAHADVFRMTLQRSGEYELRVHARDVLSGEKAVAVEPFRVVGAPSAGGGS